MAAPPSSQGPDIRSLQNSYGPEMVPHSWPEAVPEPTLEVVPNSHLSHQVITPYKPEGSHEAAEGAARGPKKKILGLPVLWFWLVIAGLVVIMGVGMGVGLGVGLSQAKDDSPSSNESSIATDIGNIVSSIATEEETATMAPTSTESEEPTSTSSVGPVTSGSTGMADNSCVEDKPTTYHAPSGDQFRKYCFRDWPNGSEAMEGEGKVVDLSYMTVYTFEECMDACLEYNDLPEGAGEKKCAAVTYNSNLTSIVDEQGGNCFLKDRPGKGNQAAAEVASAMLVD